MSRETMVEEKLNAAKLLDPLILKHRQEIDQGRRLPDAVVKGMADIGIFRSMIPVS